MRRIVLACLAAGLAGTAAPIPAAYAEPAFGGYSTEATATPVKIEIYEPTIPVPASPQAELDLAYTKAEAASGPTGKGVASWLWPGDPVGEGCKTFVEQLGLGQTGLCKDGYPVQVNSETPGDQGQQSDEPFPGSLMRTSSSPKGVRSTVGWSSNHDVSDKDQPGRSNCTGGCATTWPAFKVENAALEGGLFTIVRRDDGVMQWAYNGKPLYFFAGDATPGDAKGDKQGGVWHVVRHGTRAAQDFAPSYNFGY
jgi:hypothetical protein